MDILLILFISLFFYKISLKKSDEFLSKDYTGYLRGILALCIVFCHISYNRRNIAVFNVFNYLGPFIVGVFFFLSGYGIISRIKETGTDKYLENYIDKRVIKLAKEYIYVWIFYILTGLVIYRNFSFFNDSIIVPHSWFIFVIEVLYIMFFFTSKIFNNNLKKNILLLNVLQIFFIIILYLIGLTDYWYISILPFGIGMIYRELNISKKNIIKTILFNIIIFILSEMSIYVIEKSANLGLTIILLKNCAITCFSIIVISMGKYISFKNPIFKYCGSISLNIYLLHGIFEMVFTNIDQIDNNNFLYGCSVIISTVIASIIYKQIEKIIINRKNNLYNKV